MRMMTLLALGILACLAAVRPASAESCGDEALGSQTDAGMVGVGQPVPAFSLTTLDGQQITHESTLGHILVLEFVAPNCPWCKRHLPRTALLSAIYAPQPVRFVAVVGQLGSESFTDGQVLDIVRATGFTGPVARDTDRTLVRTFAALLDDRQMHYPATFVLDFDGRVEAAVTGYGRESEIQAAIARLLGKPINEDDLLFPPPSPSRDADPLPAAEPAPIPLAPTEAAAPTVSEVDRETLSTAIPTEPESATAVSAVPPVAMEYIFHSATNRTIAIRRVSEPRAQARGFPSLSEPRAPARGFSSPAPNPEPQAPTPSSANTLRMPARPAGASSVRFVSRAEADSRQPAPARTPLDDLAAASVKSHPNAVSIADAFLTRYGWAFTRDRTAAQRIADTATDTATDAKPATANTDPPLELLATSAERDGLGMTHVRYQRHHDGIPVFGAEVIVHIAPDGTVSYAGGNAGTAIASATEPSVTLETAVQIARQEFRAAYPNLRSELKKASLCVLQPSLLTNTGDASAYLTWDVRLVNENAWIDVEYFVDAVNGAVVQRLNNVRRLKGVYDCSAKPGTGLCSVNVELVWNNQWLPWTPPPESYIFSCSDNKPCPRGANPRYLPEVSTDTDDLFVLLGDVHSYYQTKFGRNGANGQGGNTDGTKYAIGNDISASYLNWLAGFPDDCLDARYWNASGVGFCKGMVVPDVVGHEYAHGVNNNLWYSDESGNLEESHSDVTGEMFEYWKTGTSDWVLGGTFSVSVSWQRNLASPGSLTDALFGLPYPDRSYSSGMYCGDTTHHNSTIPSKAMYLASMGGTFNGCTIDALGREKVEQILYRAKTLYWAGSETFNGAYADLIQSCADLYGAGSNDCRQLTKALQSVELDQPGRCSDPSGALWHPPYLRDVKADLKPDSHVDAADLDLFKTCLTGSSAAHPDTPLCHEADFDGDGDVDQSDFGILQRCYTGPTAPTDPGCNP